MVSAIYVFQGQEVRSIAVMPMYNPSDPDLCGTRGGNVTDCHTVGAGTQCPPPCTDICLRAITSIPACEQIIYIYNYYPEHVLTWEGNRRVCSLVRVCVC